MAADANTRAALAEFCESLGALLQRYGAPSHRVEEALLQVAGRFGHRGQFFATNTALLGSLDGAPSQVFLRRSEPGDINLGKLAQLESVVDALVTGETTIPEAGAAIGRIDQSPNVYPRALDAVAYILASAGAACFFGGGIREIIVAGMIGFITALLSMVRRLHTTRLFEIVAAYVAVIAAHTLAVSFRPLSVSTAMLAGLIVLFPGLTLTTAIIELANRHQVSGSARLIGALLTFLCIALGVVFGTQSIVPLIGAPGGATPITLGIWSEAVALLVTPAAIMVIFRAETRDLPWMTITAILAYAVVRLGAAAIDPAIAAFLAAAVTGLCGNAFARVFHRPPSITIVPSLMILVPGSLGFRSITQLLSDEVVTGVASAFKVGIIAMAIVAGLLVANALFGPSRS